MKQISFLLLAALICISSYAQNYDVKLIPDSLIKNANAVLRNEELTVIIKSSSKAIIKNKYAITILNDDGQRFASYEGYYSKMRDLQSISGKLYDANGKELKTVRKKDIADYSSNDDMSLMTDSRYKTHNFYYSQYPYTIEYEDEVELDGIFYLPSWHPVGSTKMGVEQSMYTVEVPDNFKINIKQIAYANPPVINTKDAKKNYTWQVKNLIPVTYEPYQPDWDEINPAVYITLSNFEIENYKGSMATWQDLGKFINNLNSNKQKLPDNIKQDVHKLTDNVTNISDKVKLLYSYMQQNTRYISVQLGIGGWQPYDANYVATKKYGDCKALSNYMVSLLKEANIPAKYVLVKAGNNEKGLWEDFPAPFFNHAIMCVPQQKDTLWLECTSQTASPGFMGSFTGNRKVLLIDEDGGHVVSTPTYKAKDNLQLRKVDAVINEKGDLTANILTHFTGTQQEDVHSLLHGATAKQKEKYLNEAISLPTYTVQKFDYTETKNVIPAVDETLSITSPNYATISGKRLFITPNFFNRSSSKLNTDDKRKYDIQFASSYMDIDTIHITIPSGYTVEAMPKPVTIKNAYGNYSINFNINGNVIDVLRKNERNEGRFSKTEYAAIVAYFNDMYKADRSRIVLVKKEG